MWFGAVLCAAAWAGPIQLKADDGRALEAVAWGAGPRGVVLVAEEPGRVAEWRAFAGRLERQGYAVVAVEPRDDPDGALQVRDVRAAITWLGAREARSVQVLGAGRGGTLAAAAAVDEPLVQGVAVLTPVLSGEPKLGDVIPRLEGRRFLVVGDGGDPLVTKAAKVLAAKVTEGQSRLYPGAGAGVRMLNRSPDLEHALLAWIEEGHATPAADAARPRPEAGEVREVKATGVPLGERLGR